MAAGLGVTEHASESRSAQEVEALWTWIRDRLAQSKGEADAQIIEKTAAYRNQLANLIVFQAISLPLVPASRCRDLAHACAEPSTPAALVTMEGPDKCRRAAAIPQRFVKPLLMM